MQKKFKIAMLIAILWIVVILVLGNLAWQSFMKEKKEEDKSYLSISKTEYGDWVIKIQNLPRKMDINETTWILQNSDGFSIKRGETYFIYDYGKIGVDSSYWNITHSKGGYMKKDDGIPLTNAIEYWENYASKCNKSGFDTSLDGKSIVVFMNNDENKETPWRISNGDEYYIRSPMNYETNFTGQKIYKGYWFKLEYAEEILMIQLT